MCGWVKLNRSLLDWQWYTDHNATRLLVHLLISVNYMDKKWRGELVKAGSMITSWAKLSEAVGLSVKQCRTAMKKLENCQEVAIKRTNKYQLITLVKWEEIQKSEQIGQATGQTKGRQRATTKEYKEIKEVGIPEFKDFKKYALDNQPNTDLKKLTHKYKAWAVAGWKDGNGKPIKNWRSKLLHNLRYLEKTQQARL